MPQAIADQMMEPQRRVIAEPGSEVKQLALVSAS